jgi:hypothetical protein
MIAPAEEHRIERDVYHLIYTAHKGWFHFVPIKRELGVRNKVKGYTNERIHIRTEIAAAELRGSVAEIKRAAGLI